MHCITVFPILKKTFADTLTYWTKESCQVGEVIQVKVQNRNIWAVVDSIIPIHEAKEYIKSQTFVIKKIDQIIKTEYFSREFILAVLDTSQYYCKPFGEVFAELVPKNILEKIEDLEPQPHTVAKSTHTTQYIQEPTSMRIDKIKEIVTDNTFILSPIKTHASYLKAQDLKNIILPIDSYKLDQADQPICILELASSEYYRHMRKDFDVRFFIRSFCKRKHIQLIESDTLLPIYREEVKGKLNYTISEKPKLHMIDLTESGKAKIKSKENHKLNLKHFSPELLSLIKHCEKKKESILLYTVRKGFSAQTVCGDCNTVFSCPTCKKPFRLRERTDTGEKMYICDTCNTSETTNRTCAVCGSWNLTPLGTSTEVVREELATITDLPIIIIDSNNQTKSSAAKVLKNKDAATIYIGTELMLTQSQSQTFDYSAIVSLESLLALPSRTAEFDAARVVYTLMERTTKDVLIQTRNPKHPLWKAVENKNWKPLIESIRTSTEELHQPPFGTHVQLHSKLNTDTIYMYLKKYVSVQKTERFDRKVLHMFFKPGEWPNSMIYPYLKSLPSSVIVEVDRTNFI
ncbi:MAG: hypothetical protein RJB39_214 [Candidatus Parcubacteria bacterium]|jgi:primosomal protein N'